MMLFDGVVLIIVLIFMLIGYKTGFALTFYKFFSWILSFIVAKIFSPVITGYIDNTSFHTELSNIINKKLINMQATGSENLALTLQNAQSGKSNGIIGDMLIDKIKSGQIIDTGNILQFVSNSLSSMIISMVSMIVIFIAVRILFAVVFKFLIKSIVKLPVIKQIDKAGGILIGFLEGIIISYILVMILNVFNLGGIEGEFDKTFVVKYFLDLDIVKATFLTIIN